MVEKIKKKLKKYTGMSHNDKRHIVDRNVKKAKEIVKRIRRISETQSHPQHKIEKYEPWDW